MAAKLQCEICGGKLIGKPGGVFECDSCGMEYDTAWAKEKIQEITGTVKVEGTVDVQGTVKIDNTTRKESLFQRGMMALEEGEWDTAASFFDEVLDYDAKCAKAYLGLAMAEEFCHNENAFFESFVRPEKEFYKNQNVLYAKRYGDYNLRLRIDTANQKHKENIEKSIIKNKKDRSELIGVLQERNLAKRLIYFKEDGIVGICSNGDILACPPTYGSDKCKTKFEITDWKDIVAVSMGGGHAIGLRGDGTVLARGDNSFGQCDIANWTDITAISTGFDYTIGLRSDGTVIAAGHNVRECCALGDWRNIVQVVCFSNPTLNGIYSVTIGLKSDGTLVTSDENLNYGPFTFSEVKNWKNIISIKMESWGIVGIELKQDGSVFTHVGGNALCESLPVDVVEKCDNFFLRTDMTIAGYSDSDDSSVLSSWNDIIEIRGYREFLCGLHKNGTVSAYIPSNSINKRINGPKAEQIKKWTNIISIYMIWGDVYGLQCDGRIVTTCEDRKYTLSHWKLFDDYRTVEAEQKAAVERAAVEKKNQIERLTNEKNTLQSEQANLTGMFSGRRRREIQSRISEIDTILAKMK